MKSVPNVVKTSLDAKLVLLEQALQAQAAGNAALAKLILKAVVEIKPVNESRHEACVNWIPQQAAVHNIYWPYTD
ncbi:hypothetical protein PtA15_13A316 [Puccinia triticina]|uniref:Uncharacterized protein n=1 Tax=Puccinia triticina TaxID=208348 RepID=A0ABY7D0F8_9BASI|nr:uncharacterized protein PtA15_13A316 [Puccinia triticina]WAQ90916.1 hypothetical protein PtA15_13A316 [Puccinia triticina]